MFESLKEQFINEIKIMRTITPHPNILKFIEGKVGILKKIDGRTINVIYIVTEYCSTGELMDYVMHLGSFPEGISRFYFLQILSAIQHLHVSDKTISHRDLKPQNLILN